MVAIRGVQCNAQPSQPEQREEITVTRSIDGCGTHDHKGKIARLDHDTFRVELGSAIRFEWGGRRRFVDRGFERCR